MGLLRVLLAISVFLFHAGITSLGFARFLDGRAAVFCFFVISGFYMELVCAEKYTKNRLGEKANQNFYLARFWRLYPTYAFVVLASTLLMVFTENVHLPVALDIRSATSIIQFIKCSLIWIANLSMLGLNLPSTSDLIIGPSWSLGVEVAFYILAPYVLRASFYIIFTLMLLGLGLQFLPYGQHAPIIFGMQFFLLGALARRYSGQWLGLISRFVSINIWIVYGMIVILVACAIPNDIYIGGYAAQTHNTLDRTIYPLFVAALIPPLHELTKKNRLDYWLGQLSFPFYLVHAIVIEYFRYFDMFGKPWLMLAITLLVSAGIVLFESYYIEPWRATFSRRQERVST